MSPLELIIRFCVSGIIITAITLLSKTRVPFLSGVMVLFPAVTLVGYYFIGQSVDPLRLKEIALFSMYTLPATFIFLIVFYYLQGRFVLNQILLMSVLAWFISASILVIANRYIFNIGG